MNRLERLEKILNKTSGNPYHDSKGKFTFSPSGVGKHARGFSSPTVIYTGDDIKLEKDGVILEGTLQYKEGKFYLLIDKEKGSLIEISKDDIRKSIVSKSAKEKQKELLESQGIRHKSPKERRTPEQKRLISELDKMGLLKDKEFGTWCVKYADEETLSDIYTTLREAESFGLDISSIQLGKIRSGQTWGRAYYRTDGNFKLALSGQIYDRNPIQEMKIKECREGFHTDNSIKAVVRHETGHIISYQNAQRGSNTKEMPKNIWQQEDTIDSYCGKVVSEAMGYSYFTYRETLKDLKKCSNSEISEYGRTNFKEAIAESWSNPNYSLFTKKVSDILKKDLKKPRENSIMNKRTEEIPICSGYGPEFEDFEYETSTGKVKTNSRIMRLCSLEKVMNSQTENLDYRYDVKAYKEYLKEWLKHKDEKEWLDGGVLSFAEFWEHDIDYEFEDYNKILKLIDEHNKKKELVTNGGPNSGNHNPGQGRGVGKPANSIDVSKYSTYEDFEQDMFRGENRKENIEKLKEQGINSKDKMYLYFVNEKFKKQKITQMSLDEAKDTILENIPKSVAEGWFIKADSSYKKKIVQLIVENDNLRSASLSLAYETYKELINKNIGFNDFLNKELDLYRGDPEGKKFIEADSTSFISYTPFEDMAKKFGKVITKKTIKPKETLGVLRQVGEFEFLVPTFNQKKDVHKSKNASVRMNDLLQKMDKILNGGPNSGNHNPGQGRGVGKPSNKTGKFVKSSSPSLKMSENSKKFYEKLNPKIQESFEKCIDRLKKTNISLDNVELEFVNSNTSGGDNGWVNVVDGDNIDSRMIVNLIKPVLKKFTKKEQDVYKHSFVADNSSEAIIDHEFGHVLMYKKAAEIGIKPKSAHLFAEMIVKNEAKKLNIDLNDESTENFSEYAHRNYTEFIAEAYSRPDYSKLTQNVSDSLCNNKYSKDDFKNFIIELTGIQTNENNSNIIRLNSILNSGPNSGNPYHDEKGRFTFGPGQGRGDGKSDSKTKYSADNYLTKAEHEKIINHSSEDNFTDDELDAIAKYVASMRYGASSDLNQAIKADSNGEITETENILFPEDDSQIVTWKDNKEFIEQKIKDKKKYDSLNEEIRLESSILRKGGLSDEKEIENLKSHLSEIVKERDDISKTLKYSDYENYVKNYEEGRYDSIKDDQKMWTINEDKLSKISIVKLREKQKSDSKRFDEILEIPRLTWSMSPDDKPTTTDTLANVYQESFKDLDKLDNIIKNKGFVLDKDITVTRRVANAKVIENQIKNKGEYTQNGITSVTAARHIAKKMPSGVNMGDDLLRITIPAGTRVVSTYNPFVRDVQKSADKYNGGNLTVDDKRNMRMIKGQNELILPSGSKFVSPKGNSISKNEDGSYQLILKVEKDKTSKNSLKMIDYLRNNISAKSYFRSQRLSAILNKVNRGNPYHDSEGKFTSKGGSFGSSALITEKGKEIDKKFKSFSDIALELKEGTHKVLGKEISGKRFDLVSGDILVSTISDNAEDENRIEEIKQQIEKEKKSGVVLITIDENEKVKIRDGSHTFAAYLRLRDEGKNYYIPFILSTPSDIDRWEKKFDSIEELEKTNKDLVNVKQFKINKEDEE